MSFHSRPIIADKYLFYCVEIRRPVHLCLEIPLLVKAAYVFELANTKSRVESAHISNIKVVIVLTKQQRYELLGSKIHINPALSSWYLGLQICQVEDEDVDS